MAAPDAIITLPRCSANANNCQPPIPYVGMLTNSHAAAATNESSTRAQPLKKAIRSVAEEARCVGPQLNKSAKRASIRVSNGLRVASLTSVSAAGASVLTAGALEAGALLGLSGILGFARGKMRNLLSCRRIEHFRFFQQRM